MGNRLSKIVTRTGDQGTTGLGNGGRIDKDSLRITVIGEVDELNCAIGLVTSHQLRQEIKDCLTTIQQQLFDLGGELCLPDTDFITAEMVEQMEDQLTQWNDQLPPLKEFILPGGDPASAHAHLARAICRRCERQLVSLDKLEAINPLSLIYLNRLSDLLFVIARLLMQDNAGTETLWRSERNAFIPSDATDTSDAAS